MSEQYKNGDQYWIINDNFPEDGWVAARWGDAGFETYDAFTRDFTVGPKLEPPPLPKKEEGLPKGIEAADAFMAIFGYERVDYVEHLRQDKGTGPLASKGHTVSYTFKNKEAE